MDTRRKEKSDWEGGKDMQRNPAHHPRRSAAERQEVATARRLRSIDRKREELRAKRDRQGPERDAWGYQDLSIEGVTLARPSERVRRRMRQIDGKKGKEEGRTWCS